MLAKLSPPEWNHNMTSLVNKRVAEFCPKGQSPVITCRQKRSQSSHIDTDAT